ncbi:MAG: hypothetical protein R3Y26_07285, partial [Rikenellaceae bacterium]
YSIQQSEGEFFLSFLSEKIFYPIPCNIQIPQLHLQVEFKMTQNLGVVYYDLFHLTCEREVQKIFSEIAKIANG